MGGREGEGEGGKREREYVHLLLFPLLSDV